MSFEGNDNMDCERCPVSSDNEFVITATDTVASNFSGFLTLMFPCQIMYNECTFVTIMVFTALMFVFYLAWSAN